MRAFAVFCLLLTVPAFAGRAQFRPGSPPKPAQSRPAAGAGQGRRAAAQRAMEQEWQAHAAAWAPRVVVPYPAARRQVFFGKVYDWAIANGLTGCQCLAKTGALLLRTKCYGWPAEDTEQAMRYFEDDDPDAALRWLDYSFDQ